MEPRARSHGHNHRAANSDPFRAIGIDTSQEKSGEDSQRRLSEILVRNLLSHLSLEDSRRPDRVRG